MIAAGGLDDDAWPPSPVGSPAVGDATPADLLTAYQEAVVRGSAVDPMTTELVRLRCARTHRCRICQTLRLAGAPAAGANEAVTAQNRFQERRTPPPPATR